jgi:uncharacterized membrane-anchored protein
MSENSNLRPHESFLIRHRSKLLIGLIAIQTLFLLGIAGTSYAVSWFGKEIRIQTVPIDPTDLLYGDYVILNYGISRLDRSLWKGASNHAPKQGDSVYVVLKPGTGTKGTYEAVGIYDNKLAVLKDEVILKGRVTYSDDRNINMKYGLEKYYVPENTGKELEKQAGKGSLDAKVKVAPWGSSVLEGLELP